MQRRWIYATDVTNKKWIKNRASINIFEKISTFYKIKNRPLKFYW